MKKYLGVLIALLPFISGRYKKLYNWSNAEAVDYNAFSLAMIIFGIYYFAKYWSEKTELIQLSHYDLAVFKASAYIKELSEDTKENATAKRVAINEIGNLVELFQKNRSKRWKNQKEVDEVTESLNGLVESNKELVVQARNINI